MKYLCLLVLLMNVSCVKEDSLKEVIEQELQVEVQSYKSIKLQGRCNGKRFFVVPAVDMTFAKEYEVGGSLCGSGGCEMYVISQKEKVFKMEHVGTYLGLIK